MRGNLAYNSTVGHLCGATCKRKTGQTCLPCRRYGVRRFVELDARGKPINPPNAQRRHATPHEKGAAVDMYFDSVSYRKTAQNMKQYFGRETAPMTIYGWIRDLTAKADSALKPMKVNAGDVWVADEVVVNVGGNKYWLFNVMDSDSRFLLAAYLSPTRTKRAASTALALARRTRPSISKSMDCVPTTAQWHARSQPTRLTTPLAVISRRRNSDFRRV